MPRPNAARSVQAEENLARRITFEREARGWSYDGTAKRLADAGCPIQASAIFKIEKGQPRRRISVDELVAFARVFEVDVNELLVPVDMVLQEAARGLLEEAFLAQRELVQGVGSLVRAALKLRAFVMDHGPDVQETIDEFLDWLKDEVTQDMQPSVLPEVEHAVSHLLDVIYDAELPEAEES